LDLSATFPEIVLMKRKDAHGWYQDYYNNKISQRDVRQLAEIDKISALPTLLKSLA